MKQKTKITTGIILLAVAVLATSVYIFTKVGDTNLNIQSNKHTFQESPTKNEETLSFSDRKTYRDKELGYQIDCPSDWFCSKLYESDTVGVALSPKEPKGPLAEDPILTVYVNDPYWVSTFMTEANKPEARVLKTKFPQYNFEAVATENEVGTLTLYYANIDKSEYVISALIPKEMDASLYDPLFFQIIQTFKPL